MYDDDRTWRINDDKITCHLNVKPETNCCRKQENQDNDKFPTGSLHYSENKKIFNLDDHLCILTKDAGIV